MSYEIIYDKVLLKTNENFIIMLLHGSNNVTRMTFSGREVADRSWGTYGSNEDISVFTAETLQKEAKRYSNDDIEYELFKERGKFVFNTDYEKWLTNLIKRAYSVEDILKANEGRYLKCNIYNIEDRPYKQIYEKRIENTLDLQSALEHVEEAKQTQDVPIYCSLCFTGAFPCRKPVKERNEEPIIVKRYNRYLYHYNGNERKYSLNIKDALVFENKAEAITLLGNSANCHQFISAINKDKPRFVVKYDFVHYIQRTTKTHLRLTENINDARIFRTKKEAERYIAELPSCYTTDAKIIEY